METPQPGDIVSFVTEYPRHGVTHAYNDVEVLPRLEHLTSREFVVPGRHPGMVRVINMNYVVNMTRDPRTRDKKGIPTSVMVTSGSDPNKQYRVTFNPEPPHNALSCTCPGYTYRQRCRHLAEAEEKAHGQ